MTACANVMNLICGKSALPATAKASADNGISRVVFITTKQQMVGVTARRIVARMANYLSCSRPIVIYQRIGNYMSVASTTFVLKLPIVVVGSLGASSKPRPTAIGASGPVHLRPKASTDRLANRMILRLDRSPPMPIVGRAPTSRQYFLVAAVHDALRWTGAAGEQIGSHIARSLYPRMVC